MEKWMVVVVIALAAVGVTAGAWQVFAGTDFEEPVPEWQPGYTWIYTNEYEVASKADVRYGGEREQDSESVTVESVTRLEVLNADAEVLGQPAYLVAMEERLGKVTVNGVVAEDAAPAEEEEAIEFVLDDACADSCVQFLWVTKEDLAIAWSPEGPLHMQYDFPLTNGKTWRIEGDSDEGIPFIAEAVDVSPIALEGIGPTRAIEVQTRADPAFLKEMRREMTEEIPSEVKLDFSISAKGTDHYVPLVANTGETRFTLRMEMSAEQGDIKGKMENSVSAVSALVDHVLDAAPPRTADDYADGPVLPHAPSDGWPFAVQASRDAVDAQLREEVTFSVDESASALESGATLRWSYLHEGPEGSNRDTYRGDSFTLQVDQPGLHRVTATVHDADGRLRGVASTQVDAYTRADLDVGNLVGTPLGVDHETTFTLAPEACPATVTVTPSQFAQGAFVVGPVGSEGERVSSSGGTHTVVLDEPGLHTLRWDDQARVGDLEVVLHASYACADQTSGSAEQVYDALQTLRDSGLGAFRWSR